MSNGLERASNFIKTCYRLLRKPNKTIQDLTKIQEKDCFIFGVAYSLYVLVIAILCTAKYLFTPIILHEPLPKIIGMFFLVHLGTAICIYLLSRLFCYCVANTLEYFGKTVTSKQIRIGLFHCYMLNLLPDIILMTTLTFSHITWGKFEEFVTALILLIPVWTLKVWSIVLFIDFVKVASRQTPHDNPPFQIHVPEWCKNIFRVFYTIFQLLIHPNQTIRKLSNASGSDVLIFILSYPIVTNMFILPPIVTEKLEAHSWQNIGFLQISAIAFLVMSFLLFVSYLSWRIICLIIHKMVITFGGNSSITTLSIGLLHFTCIVTFVDQLIALPVLIQYSIYNTPLTLIKLSYIRYANILSYVLYAWLSICAIRFIKTSTHLSYTKTIITWAVPGVIVYALDCFIPDGILDIVKYPIISWFI